MTRQEFWTEAYNYALPKLRTGLPHRQADKEAARYADRKTADHGPFSDDASQAEREAMAAQECDPDGNYGWTS